jgi:hypothetical protein
MADDLAARVGEPVVIDLPAEHGPIEVRRASDVRRSYPQIGHVTWPEDRNLRHSAILCGDPRRLQDVGAAGGQAGPLRAGA